CRLRRSHPQGRQAFPSAGAAAHQVRALDQRQDRQGARPRRPADGARPRRRGDRMNSRRQFITLLGGATAWPLTARPQQGGGGRAAGDAEGQKQAAVLRRGLEELHWLSPRNLEIEYRWTAGDPVRAQAQAKEIVELGVDVIVANGTPALVAARRAAETIPIVFVAVADPVAPGFVRSLAQPGGMITGFGSEEPSMGAKWVEVLKEIAPRVASITVMFNPDSAPFARMFLPSMQALRSAASFELMEATVASESDVE